MPPFESAKEEVKEAADIAEVIGEYVQLKKAGRNYIGLCPFHSERDPSFTVSPARQMFHCFGCKKGGDIFAFWMEYHQTTFSEALRDLAERYNVTIPEKTSSLAEKRENELKDGLFYINEKATAYFQGLLENSSKGEPGRNYFRKRGLSEETVSRFRLGFASDEWQGLTSFLRPQKADLDLASKAGLIIPREKGGYYDRFRGRVIFPIFDLKDKVVGFGGRVLDNALPKYLNTPETPLFRKGEQLYGLNSCYKAIREKGRAVVVEGYMDCLAAREKGLDEIVAALGTALTASQVRKLKGYAKEAIAVFDSDQAGKTAALKSLPIFLNEGLSARAVVLPDGHDPDSFINEHGLGGFIELLDGAPPLFDFCLEQILTHEASGVEEKVRVLTEMLPVISKIREGAKRSLHVQHFCERTGIKEEVVLSELERVRDSSGRVPHSELKKRLAISGANKYNRDLHFLNLLIHFPQHIERLMANEWDLLISDTDIMEIVRGIFEAHRVQGQFSPMALLQTLGSESAQQKMREALLLPPFYSNQTAEIAVREFEQKLNQIKLSQSINKAKERGDLESLNKILKLKSQNALGTQDI